MPQARPHHSGSAHFPFKLHCCQCPIKSTPRLVPVAIISVTSDAHRPVMASWMLMASELRVAVPMPQPMKTAGVCTNCAVGGHAMAPMRLLKPLAPRPPKPWVFGAFSLLVSTESHGGSMKRRSTWENPTLSPALTHWLSLILRTSL